MHIQIAADEQEDFWDVYEGLFVDGKRNGRGKMVYALGGVYEGMWQNVRSCMYVCMYVCMWRRI